MKFSLPKIKIDSERIKSLSQKVFQDKYEKILRDLIELETDNPGDMRVKQKIAEIYFKKNKIDESIDKYKEIAAHYEKEEFILKSIEACKSILKIRPELVDYNLKLASLFLKIGMTNEAANQFRIAINFYASVHELEKTIRLSQDLVKIDPSDDNRAKLAEIYQHFGMTDEAIKQYEILAKNYRIKKDYNKLLHFYEMLLPHKKENKDILKDVCILNLRKQNPQRTLKILEQYAALDDSMFEDLVKKAKLMLEVMRKQKK